MVRKPFYLMQGRLFLCSVAFLTLLCCSLRAQAPAPYGPLPTPAQMAWQKMENYLFIHFGPNTFTSKEWGDGKESPQVFNPSDLDCAQWVETALQGGMKGIIITAKHHDGFCLWPSAYSTHTVRESPWKNGRGDILKELSAACQQAGLKFGVYLSPWDRNHPTYGTGEYNQVFANMLTEVLTSYGEVFEVWFDGANGEGPNGKRQEYDWELFHHTVYKHQPQAIIFSDIGPGCRWIGNEAGYAGETNWSRLDTDGFMPGKLSPPLDTLNMGNRFGRYWVPGEADVSIRPGWFYSPKTDNEVKSVEELVEIYFASVGRNANLLLNVPVAENGRIHPNDSVRVAEFRRTIDRLFAYNLAKHKKASASTVRGNDKTYAAQNVLDGDYDAYWTVDDGLSSAWLEIDLGEKTALNCMLLQEYIPLGQRVARFDIEAWNEAENGWTLLAEGTTIGYKRMLRFQTVHTDKIRLHVRESLASPILNNIEIYHLADKWLPQEEGKKEDYAVVQEGALPTEKWKVLSPADTLARGVIDGKTQAISIAIQEPILLDLGEELSFRGFFYLPESAVSAPNISRYHLMVSLDGNDWVLLKKQAMFDNIKHNPIRQIQFFDEEVRARYVKLQPLELTHDSDEYKIAEFGLLE